MSWHRRRIPEGRRPRVCRPQGPIRCRF
jgi:hypothetical protein